jgi:eukaryotic-like serine/threonine-protein kinase
MTPDNEARFAEHLVAHGYASDEELVRARQTLAGRTDVVPIKSLAQALVQTAAVTPNQIRRVLAVLKEESTAEPTQTQIPGYEILSRLGRGSQAVVYKARQVSMDRTVALKVLDRKVALSPEFRERFVKEARSAAALSHNNIVQGYDVGEYKGVNYFVQEYVEGTTVADVLRERGKPFNEPEALDLIIQIAEALAHAHSRGFIHRDVKPKNIMLTPAGVAKLADMGLARQASDVETAMAEAGKAFGTPYYIAPEQIRGDPHINFRADIYSLGATLYQMVTGRVPFEAPTPQQVMQKHLAAPLVPPDHINTHLSAGISEVIEVMMAKNPKDRYQSTEDLLLDLRAVRAGQPPALARQLASRAGGFDLSGLEEGQGVSEDELAQSRSRDLKATPPAVAEAEKALKVTQVIVYILAGLLLASIVANVILLTH